MMRSWILLCETLLKCSLAELGYILKLKLLLHFGVASSTFRYRESGKKPITRSLIGVNKLLFYDLALTPLLHGDLGVASFAPFFVSIVILPNHK